MSVSHKRVFSLLAAAAVSLLSLSANAAERADGSALSKTVKTWDLDLAKTADVQKLNARVRDAAHAVCAKEAHRHWSNTRRAVPAGWRETCVNDAVPPPADRFWIEMFTVRWVVVPLTIRNGNVRWIRFDGSVFTGNSNDSPGVMCEV